MPELAEVETVKNTLKKRILNKKIKDVIINYRNMLDNDETFFKNVLIHNEIKDIKRCGKWLLFELKDYYLLSHLRMEGKYFIKSSDERIEKHEHIIIRFEDGIDLRYHDTRKFGRMKVVRINELNDTPEIKKQGKDVFDNSLNISYLKNIYKSKSMPIKTCLLDQEIIAGLGNIYADEVLFAAKINPLRKPNSLNDQELNNIIMASRKILKKAIEEGGTTIRSYTSSLGVEGNYQNYLMVHKKEGDSCLKCGALVKRIKVGGRSTYYCPKCQK